MTVISLKDYAAQKNISYEAVRQQVVRYKDDLAGHIIVDGRQQFLDEDAVAFLDARRQKNPVAIIQQSKDEAIQQLREEKEALLVKVAAVQDLLIQEKERTRLAELAAAKVELLEAAAADREAKIEQAAADLQTAQEAALQAQAAQRAAELEAEKLRETLEAERSKPIWKRIFGL